MTDTKVKETLKKMIIGSLIYNIVVLILTIALSLLYCKMKKNPDVFIFVLKNVIGVVLGFIWSCISIYSMASTLEKALSSQDSNYAKSHVALFSTLRLVIFCIILVILINNKLLGMVGGLLFAIASFGTKIGTYIVPFMNSKEEKK